MNKTILIIDTEFNEYRFLKDRLEQLSFIVHTSTDYKDGLNNVFNLKPDLIIYNFHLFLLSKKEFNGR